VRSCIYRGDIYHKRFSHGEHTFRYKLDYAFIDLDEVDEVFSLSSLWSANKPNLVSFQRQDYLPGECENLRDEVIHRIELLGGGVFSGKVYLLSTLRCLGYCMNPISLFYCYEKDGQEDELRYVLAEVHNTPWDERHLYLLEGPNFKVPMAKTFHVSPFMPMDTTYHWKISDPDSSLSVAINVSLEKEPLFTASISLTRHALTGGNVTQMIGTQIRQAFRTISAIYIQAVRLWLKKVPFYDHPNKKKAQESN
jgi:DUF1365 family protein